MKEKNRVVLIVVLVSIMCLAVTGFAITYVVLGVGIISNSEENKVIEERYNSEFNDKKLAEMYELFSKWDIKYGNNYYLSFAGETKNDKRIEYNVTSNWYEKSIGGSFSKEVSVDGKGLELKESYKCESYDFGEVECVYEKETSDETFTYEGEKAIEQINNFMQQQDIAKLNELQVTPPYSNVLGDFSDDTLENVALMKSMFIKLLEEYDIAEDSSLNTKNYDNPSVGYSSLDYSLNAQFDIVDGLDVLDDSYKSGMAFFSFEKEK